MIPDVGLLRATFTHEAIERLVHRFYADVRADEELGPIFDSRITDWPHHLDRMCLFWGSVLRAEAGYRADERGSPRVIHQSIPGLTLEHYDRWLGLFDRAARDIFEPWAADNVVGRAQRMAMTLSSGLERAG